MIKTVVSEFVESYEGYPIYKNEDGYFWIEDGYFDTLAECRESISDYWDMFEYSTSQHITGHTMTLGGN